MFNVGNDEHLSLRSIADLIVAAAGTGSVDSVPWPPDRDSIDIGSYFGDSSKAKRVLGWIPETDLRRRHRPDGRLLSRAPRRTCKWHPIPALDLSRRAACLEPDLSRRDRRVLERGVFLLGPETEAFEAEFAAFCGRRHAVAVASGTEALRLALLRHGRGRATKSSCPRMTAVPTAAAVVAAGAMPVFADVDRDTARSTPAAAAAAVTDRTRAVIPVHLYGRRADAARPRRAGLEDAAQAHGALDPAAPSVAQAYSFYPTKNLGGIGDGGAVVTDDADVAATIRTLRNHARRRDTTSTSTRPVPGTRGCPRSKPRRCGSVCAVLADDNARRRAVAAAYRDEAPDFAGRRPTPAHVYHLCVARVPIGTRGGPAARSRPRCTTRGRSPSRPATSEFVREPCPKPRRGQPSAYRCPAFPRSPTTRSRQCVADSSEPGGRVDLGVLPLLQRRSDHRLDGRPRGRHDRLASASDGEVIVINDGSTDESRARAEGSVRRASPACGS